MAITMILPNYLLKTNNTSLSRSSLAVSHTLNSHVNRCGLDLFEDKARLNLSVAQHSIFLLSIHLITVSDQLNILFT